MYMVLANPNHSQLQRIVTYCKKLVFLDGADWIT